MDRCQFTIGSNDSGRQCKRYKIDKSNYCRSHSSWKRCPRCKERFVAKTVSICYVCTPPCLQELSASFPSRRRLVQDESDECGESGDDNSSSSDSSSSTSKPAEEQRCGGSRNKNVIFTPPLLRRDTRRLVVDLNISPGFGQHLQSGIVRCLTEIIQNFFDQCRVKAFIEDDVRARLKVSLQKEASQSTYTVSYQGRDLGYILFRTTHSNRYELRVINRDTEVSYEAFQNGHSGKRRSLTSAGFFGDGLKVALSGMARENIEFSYWSGDKVLEFVFENSAFHAKQSLMFYTTQTTTPTSDLVFSAVLQKPVEKHLQDCFLYLHQNYKVVSSCDMGTIVKGPSPGMFLHGIRVNVSSGFSSNSDLDEYAFDVTIATSTARKMLSMGRDREVSDKSFCALASEIVMKCLVEDKAFFRKKVDKIFGPSLEKCRLENGIRVHLPKNDFLYATTTRMLSSLPVLNTVMYNYIKEKLGTSNVLAPLKNGEMYGTLASVIGRDKVVIIEDFEGEFGVCGMVRKAREYIQPEGVITMLRSDMEALEEYLPDDMKEFAVKVANLCADFDQTVTVKWVKILKVVSAPALLLENTLFVDIAGLVRKHYSSCTGDDEGCRCLTKSIIDAVTFDLIGEYNRERRDLLMFDYVAKVWKEKLGAAPAITKIAGNQPKQKSLRSKVEIKTKLKQVNKHRVAWHDVEDISNFQRVEEKIHSLRHGHVHTNVNTWLSLDNRCDGYKDCLPPSLNLKSVKVGVVDKEVILVEDGEDVSLMVLESNIRGFKEIVHRVEHLVRERLPNLPSVHVFYQHSKTIWGCFYDGCIYLNLAPYVHGLELAKSVKHWLSVVLHEVCHSVVMEHNSEFSQVLGDLMAEYIVKE